ncbi:MAG: hypothetical protein ABIN61_02470 [candidate division WOR-3 bacterium]
MILFILLGVQDTINILKEPFSSYEDSLSTISSTNQLYKIDSILLSRGLFEKSKSVEEKLINIIKDNSDYLNPSLAKKYFKLGITDLKKGEIEKGERELIFASELDPSNRKIPLALAKLHYPKIGKMLDFLQKYFLTFKFLHNKIFLIKSLIFFFVVWFLWLLIAIFVASFVYSLSYIMKWFQIKFNISGLWTIAIFLALFVWLPLRYILLILVVFSLFKMSKSNLIKAGLILICLSFLFSYSYLISNNYKPTGPVYRELKARYIPNSSFLQDPVTPYGYLVKGIESAKKGDFSKAISLLEEGYKLKKDISYLENLCSVHYTIGDTSSAIKLCESILTHHPKSEIANIVIIKILLDKLELDKATEYINKSGIKISGTSLRNNKPPFKYPPDRWLYEYVFLPRGIIIKLIDNKLYFITIIGVALFLVGVFKKYKENYCSICKSFIMKDSKDNVCVLCAKKLSTTSSKSIRERVKTRISKRATNIDKATNILMNLVIPGSAHFYKNKNIEGIIIGAIMGLFFSIYIYSILYQPEEALQYKTSIGNNILKISLFLTYSLVILSSWRLRPYGNGR